MIPLSTAAGRALAVASLALSLTAPTPHVAAQEEETAPVVAEEPRGPVLSFHVEAKANFRQSDENRFQVRPAPEIGFPPGSFIFLETVDEGSHLELSTVTLFADVEWGESLAAHFKIDTIDLYDRNPTSEDHRIDVDEAWIRFGRASEPAVVPERAGVYLEVGKMPKFERQNDRHLESYGLASTAFNRFEDFGVELGVDLGRYLYLRGTLTTGNPVFIRDPNALAGDNGTERILTAGPQGEPPLESGVLILYDAEIEDFDTSGETEVGAGLGLRFSNADGSRGVDFLAFGYQRDLADTVALNGTLYGGDLDLLNGPLDIHPLQGLDGREKKEVGGNLWLYLDGLSFFGQYVDQEVAGLQRKGFEGELAWRFDLPVVWGLAGQQLFPSIQPAVRYSKLDPDFRPSTFFPAPSVTWEWEKLDYGLRVGIVPGVDLTLEYSDNNFTLLSGAERDNDELLVTLRFKK